MQIGRYRIIAPIGTGGMGVVYEAHDDELDRAVAIKVLRRDLAPGSTGRQRLVREAQATGFPPLPVFGSAPARSIFRSR